MKLKINEVEEKLGVSLRRSVKILGMDTAFKRSGWCLIESGNTYLTINYGTIDISGEDIYVKYNEIIEIFNNIIQEGYVVMVEDTFLKRLFIKGKMLYLNPAGFKKISRVGAIAYTLAYLKGCVVEYILATASRKKVGLKKKKKADVHKELKDKLDIGIKDEDVIDAFILSLSGLVKE